MARFKNEEDMLDAMGGVAIVSGRMLPPRNLSKAKLKKWAAPGPPYKWADCGCTAFPLKDGTYIARIDTECKAHANVQGNVPQRPASK